MKAIIYILISLALLTADTVGQVAVIVNKSVNVSSLDASQLLEIYSLNVRTWGDGSPISLYSLRGNESVEQRFFAFLGRKPLEMRKLWLRVQLSGEGKAPTTVSSEEDLVQKVASSRSAIGFVSLEKVNNTVKIVAMIE